MKSPTLLRRLTTHACVALLLSGCAPAGAAQRRRRAPATPRPQAQAPARPSATPEAAPSRSQQSQQSQPAQQTRRAEPGPSVEEMLAADSYTVYLELRRVGTLARAEEVKSAVASLNLLGGAEAKPITDLYAFVSDNAEALGESRVVVTFMPARPEVPQALLAVELESSDAAVAFEPKMRRMLGERVPQVKKAIAGAAPEPVLVPKPDAGERARGAAKPAAADFALRRVGRWLLAADAPFTLKRLRGDEDQPRLADSPRFQSVRARFASDSLFVYVDTNVAQQGWALQMQRASEGQQPQDTATTGVVLTAPGVGVIVGEREPGNPEAQPEPTAAPESGEPATTPQVVEDVKQSSPEVAARIAEAEGNLAEHNNDINNMPPPPPPSEEEVAVRGMGRVLGGLWGGVPRIPGAVALGAGLDRGALAVRLAVENTPDGTISIIPFLPNVVSGPPVTGETAAVAPADAELFVAGSLDWTQIYNSTLGAASVNPATLAASFGGGEEEGGAKAERQPTADETIAAVEKLFGFKFKEDLLPALGNEVSISLPLNTGDFGLGRPRPGGEEKKEEREAEPGFVFIAALNNPDRVREILPRALVAFGFAAPGTPRRAEKRKGFDIHTLGASDGFSYAIINNYLVGGELKAVRHCVDSFDARQTLASANVYRDAVAWQAKQKLLHLYLSDSVMKGALEETKKRSGASTDPVVRTLLAQLEAAETAPASYEATNEGDVLMHEVRLPISLVRSYALTLAVSAKDYPVIANETMAVYALNRIAGAQSAYKDDKKKGRYGTFEELIAEELLEKTFLENAEYKFELEVAGDKFEVSATPRTYGKSGRRSFLLDQTGTVRAADHKGQPAKADDPAVEQ
jgi:hypothetical protein